jgi:hypothetical protein
MDSESNRMSNLLFKAAGFGAAALCMPVLFGVGASVGAVVFDLGFRGMDSYLPLFVGGLIGCVPGTCLMVAGLVLLVQALRCRPSNAA